jgi:hypothetical protein
MEYMLYQQRVEPETRSLPQPVMSELTMELGRPPTIEEIQQREIANRSAARVRTGAILQRSSFDEDQAEPTQEATGPVPVMDGSRPQAGGPSAAPNPLRGDAMEGYEPQAGVPGSDPRMEPEKQATRDSIRGLTPTARKQVDTKRDVNGPMLRSGPQKAFALRPEEMDKEQVIQAERERAEVGVAPPVAISPR